MSQHIFSGFRLVLGMLTFLAQPAVADELPTTTRYLAEITRELAKQWPENRRVTIVCHGHSVPTGYFATPEVRPFDSYPHLLEVAIHERFPTCVAQVIRTGIGGEDAEQGAKRFRDDVLAKRPDVVTIDYSLNDRRIGLERAKAAWTTMIEQAKAVGVKVILFTPTPDTRARLDDPNDPLRQHAEQVRQLATEHQVALVDSTLAFDKFVANGGVLADVMAQVNHPNRQGHELVTAELSRWFLEPVSAAASD